MTPTLAGRLQTRWIMVWTVGLSWLLIVGPHLPLAGPNMRAVYATGIATLVLVALVGSVWECIYHIAQQFRWDKDWPTLLGLLLGVPEAVVVYQLLARDIPWNVRQIDAVPYAWQFGSVWLAIWVFTNGPIRIFFPRWRFAGGRFW